MVTPPRKPAADRADVQPPKDTPDTDLQPEDTGSSSGQGEGAQRGTASNSAMKQTSKTPHEAGDDR